ncbi:MAG TPA: hypothetical protein VFJ13_12180 [Paracoccaceae bacterium]|nr:hypothetical protein [Paracoccaceae bacterium]
MFLSRSRTFWKSGRTPIASSREIAVYARAAAWIAGVDRWPESTWRDLEQQLGAGEADPESTSSAALDAAPEAAAGMVRRRRARGRRVITPSYLR